MPAAAKQVTPMLCIPKKNGTLRTIFDLQQQNKNTWKDITPFPDQDAIHHDIAQATFRSKLDMTEAYEQTHIRPEDVGKTTFSTIFGTFQSQVMQMGDCNAPSTFQRLMTTIFRDFYCYIFVSLSGVKILNIVLYMSRHGVYACVHRWAICVRPHGV